MRAVSETTSTLLLVAIAVVGGSIIFVFSQGMLSDYDVFLSSGSNELYVQEFDCPKWQVNGCTYIGTSRAGDTSEYHDIQFKKSGNFIFVVDSERYAIHKYVLDIPFDIRSQHFSESMLWGNGDAENFLKGVKFSSEGDKMYFLGTRGDERVRSGSSMENNDYDTEFSKMQKIIALQEKRIKISDQVIKNQEMIIELQDAIIKGEESELVERYE